MHSNLRILYILVALTLVTAGVWWLQGNQGRLDRIEGTDFGIVDTSKVDKIFIADMDGVRDWEGEYVAGGALPTPAQVSTFLKGSVSWFDPKTHRPNMFKRYYPGLEDTLDRVPMSWVQTLEYLMALRSGELTTSATAPRSTRTSHV